jgi:hypothetical protein
MLDIWYSGRLVHRKNVEICTTYKFYGKMQTIDSKTEPGKMRKQRGTLTLKISYVTNMNILI